MSELFDLGRYRQPAETPSTSSLQAEKEQGPPKRVKGRFVKGPVPLGWLERAGRLPGKALHVGMFLWFRVGLTKAMTVKPSYEELNRLGVLPDAFRRALKKLEEAKLVTTDKHPGRKTRITIQLPDGCQ